MFFFFIGGIDIRYRKKEGLSEEVGFCPVCGSEQTMEELIPVKYFTLFFYPHPEIK